jgi:hypothetical protein
MSALEPEPSAWVLMSAPATSLCTDVMVKSLRAPSATVMVSAYQKFSKVSAQAYFLLYNH